MRSAQDTVDGVLAVQLGLASPADVQAAGEGPVLVDLEARGLISGPQRAMIDGMSRQALAAHDGALDATVDAVAGVAGLEQTFGGAALAETMDSGGDEAFASDADVSITVTREQPGRYRAPGPDRADNELGRGGIGRVLVVEDAHLGREVALKELLAQARPQRILGSASGGSSASSITVTRFLREARITGRLEHPNIVPVYELGQRRDGTLYYTMKVVRGRTMADALKECSSLADRLLLLKHFADLCNAMAYAHARGVIHRDLKPGNVMLGEFGETVVLDWGLARAVDGVEGGEAFAEDLASLDGDADQAETLEGAIVGTPLYMSPEQAAGAADIGPQADVWSLGVMLYELITGERPFTGRSTVAVLARIAGGDLEPIAKTCPDAPPDLAAVAERALSRDPAVRYADAGALAAEIGAFLMGGEVKAYRYGLGEIVRRFARRHRVALAVAAVGLVLLAATGAWAYARVVEERDQAIEARQKASIAATEAREAEARARVARDEAEGLVQFMVGDMRRTLEPLGRLDLLDGVVERVQAHVDVGGDEAGAADPARRRSRAGLRYLVARLAAARGRSAEAESQATEALRLRTGLAEATGAPADVLDRALSELQVAGLRLGAGDRDAAAAGFDAVIGRLEPLAGADDADPEALLALARAHASRAAMRATGGDLPAAEASYRTSLTWRTRLAEREPTVPRWQYALALGHDSLGDVRLDQGAVDDAEVAYRAALDLRRALVQTHPENLQWVHKLGVSHDQLGDIHTAREAHDAALAAYTEATSLMTRAFAANPTHLVWRRDAAVGRLKAADALAALGRTDAALRAVAGVVDTLTELVEQDRREVSWVRDLNVARWRQVDLLTAAGRFDAAAPLVHAARVDAARIVDDVPGSARYRHDLAVAWLKIGNVAGGRGDPTAAALAWRRAGRMLGELAQADPSDARIARHRRLARARLAGALDDPGLDPVRLWAGVGPARPAVDAGDRRAPPAAKVDISAGGARVKGETPAEAQRRRVDGRSPRSLLDDPLLGPPGEEGEAIRPWIGSAERAMPREARVAQPTVRPADDVDMAMDEDEAEETPEDDARPTVRPSRRARPQIRPSPKPAAPAQPAIRADEPTRAPGAEPPPK